jgi:hypothetical protein
MAGLRRISSMQLGGGVRSEPTEPFQEPNKESQRWTQ